MRQEIGRERTFEIRYGPAFWVNTARGLAAAAETIIEAETPKLVAYLQAAHVAGQNAIDAAQRSGQTAIVEIDAEEPNYQPAELLYAFAIENVLKAAIVNGGPSRVGVSALPKDVKSHDLLELAKRAKILVAPQEEPVLRGLSDIALWAGRYPTPSSADDYAQPDHPYLMGDARAYLDTGSQHPTMRRFFNRALAEVLTRVPGQFPQRSISVAQPILGLIPPSDFSA